MAEATFMEMMAASGGLGLLYWWARSRKEKKTQGKWLKIMEPLARQLDAPIEVIDTPFNSYDTDLRIVGRFQGYRVEAECWQEDTNGYPRVLRVRLRDPAMPPQQLLKALRDNRVGNGFTRINKGIEFRRSERHKNHRWINWKRILNEMVDTVKKIREEERDRVVIR